MAATRAAAPRGPTVIIGIGNELRGDDAAGLLVARQLRGEQTLELTVRESDGDPVDLMDAWKGAESAIIVDAMVCGARPGTVRRFDVGERPLPAALFAPASTHVLDVPEVVELGRALGSLPARLLVYGICGCDFEPGEHLSTPVARGVTCAVRRIESELAHTSRVCRARRTGPERSPRKTSDKPGRGAWRTA